MKAVTALAVTSLLVAGCSDSGEVSHQFDHVMVGIADLDAGTQMLAEMTGLTAAYGGIHPGRDTRNALLSLGGGRYFELIAPQAGLETITDPIAAATLELNRPTPMHWAVATNDIEATRALVEQNGWRTTAVDARSRATPDGGLLSWQMFFIADASDAAAIPFFIEWDQTSAHPSQTSPGGCELAEFRINTPDALRIAELLEVLGLDIEVSDRAIDSLDLALICAGTNVSF